MELDNKFLLNIWKKGKPLNEAVWHFCDQKYIDKYPGNCPKIESKSNEASENLLEGISSILTEYQVSKRRFDKYDSQIKSAKDNMLNNLFEKIISGKLIAIGFKSPIESDFPVLIPLHMWSPESIDMDKSSISANEIDFVRVRIIKESTFKQIENKQSNVKEISLPKIKDKKKGRPSLKKEIIAAYEYLKESNKIDYSKAMKSHTELIQKTVLKLNPEIKDMKGMQHEAIRRTISPLFQVDKENL